MTQKFNVKLQYMKTVVEVEDDKVVKTTPEVPHLHGKTSAELATYVVSNLGAIEAI